MTRPGTVDRWRKLAGLMHLAAELDDTERTVLQLVAERLKTGQRRYGRFDLATDRRDWHTEALERSGGRAGVRGGRAHAGAGMNAKRKGTRNEHRSRRLLETAGYAVTGTIASEPLPAASAPRKGRVGNLTLDEAAAESRMSVRPIRRALWGSQPPLRHSEIGARVVIGRIDLQQWLNALAVVPVVRQRTSDDSGGRGTPITPSATARPCTASATLTGRVLQ